MTTDNKTLADAQPGGRVRLGDPLTRFRCAGYDPTDGSGPIMIIDPEGPWVLAADVLSTSRNGNAASDNAETSASKDDWFGDVLGSIGTAIPLGSALSAQPSPGGQDARELLAAEFDKNEVTAAAARRLRNHNETAVEAAALRVIAARQPVGEPAARLIEAVEGECEGLAISCDTAASILAHVFPAGQVATAYMVDGRIEQGLFFDRTAAERMAAMNAGEVVPLFRSPAQAVDLGGIPEGWRLSKKAPCYQLSHGNDIIGNLVGPDAEENAAIIARVLDSHSAGGKP